MAMNRNQFQPGLSLAGFLDRYGTEAAFARALKRARWPKGLSSPAAMADGSVVVRICTWIGCGNARPVGTRPA